MADKGPDATSADYDFMAPAWQKVETIRGGADAMKAAGKAYLPQFPNESDVDYDYRRKNAKFTNIYADIVSTLASKPFSEEVTISEDAPEAYKALTEDIDGRGRNLQVFASEVFENGIDRAIDWIFVDFTKAKLNGDGRPLTRADERRQGLRPYWVRIPASSMLAVYTAMVDGREVFIHARFREDVVERVGYEEVTKKRVRVLDRAPLVDVDGQTVGYAPATYELFELQSGPSEGKETWVSIEFGPVSIGEISLVPFVAGKRLGTSWRFLLPMQAAADLQVEHYQQETALKSIKELTAFPMLAGNGVAAPTENGKVSQVPVGPKSVLFAPPSGDRGQHGEWAFIEPSAESLRFLASDVEVTEKQLRDLGRMPLVTTAGITTITAALASQKASSAVQAWALALKDALELAWTYTAKWMGEPEVEIEVSVFTDFDMSLDNTTDFQMLVSMRKSGPAGGPDISRQTLWEEARRRGILCADFDAEEESDALDGEMPDADTEDDLASALTPPTPTPQPNPAEVPGA